MARFNEVSQGTKTQNKAGGEAYSQSPEMELVSILLTSFANDQFYETANQKFDNIKSLLNKVDPLFAAKAGIFARTEFGMRSISHVLAAELAPYVSKKPWGKSFYDKIVYRPDDMTEIISFLKGKKQKLPNALKKGFASAFGRFDEYQLAKYRGENKSVKLVDVVNLVHPVPNGNSLAIENLVNGTLKSKGTWETKLTQAGQQAKTKKEKEQLKEQAWITLVKERKIGYFALLRNLRNIIEQAPDLITDACDMLTQEKLIKKSLVLPFRFSVAYNEIRSVSSSKAREVLVAISEAIDKSMVNVPKFKNTLVVCDYSGSMGEGLNSRRGIGTLFGISLAKASNADFMIFGSYAEYINFNPIDSTMSIVDYANSLNSGWGESRNPGHVGHGTNFHSIFETANKKYDRIVIFSDMQGWIGHSAPTSSLLNYNRQYDANPFIYSIDLAGHGTLQFPENKIFCLAGFSEKMFDLMKLLETDKKAMINKINSLSL